MNDGFNIRIAKVCDIEVLLELYTHLSPEEPPAPLDKARTALEQLSNYPGSGIFLGETDGTTVASCTLIVVPNLTRGATPYGLIENVVTHAANRRKGFGQMLLDAACERAWDCGCYKIMLSTGSQNPVTLAFYERAGFTQSRTGFQKRRIAARPEQG